MGSKALINPKTGEMFLPPDEQLRATLPHRAVRIKGKTYDAYPHTTDATRFARNCGFVVPAPVFIRYPWADTDAFHTQKLTAALLTMNRRAYVLNEMGTGKTRAALYAIDWMLTQNEIKTVLVAAPLSTLDTVWAYEIMRYFPHLTSSTLYSYSKKAREKRLAEKADIYIVNHHGVETILDGLKKLRPDVILIDELAVYRNSQTNLWKAMNALTPSCQYVWGMTGSPTPDAPTDAYGQVKLLTPAKVPKYFKAFKRDTMVQVSQFRWIPQADATEKVHAVMQPAVRFTRDEVVELPPVSYSYRKIEQSKRQQQVYKDLMTKLTLAFSEGRIKAVNEGVLFSKLLQIASGWVYTSERNIVDLNPRNRLIELADIIDQSVGKVIVFADFVHCAEHVAEWLTAKKYNLAMVSGKTPAHIRNKIFGDFQNQASPRVLVAHPKCMAHGLTLTSASTMVWYTPTTSLETYEQACARITRPGQKNKQLIIHLTGTTVESKVYRRLREKASVQGALLDMFAEAQV